MLDGTVVVAGGADVVGTVALAAKGADGWGTPTERPTKTHTTTARANTCSSRCCDAVRCRDMTPERSHTRGRNKLKSRQEQGVARSYRMRLAT